MDSFGSNRYELLFMDDDIGNSTTIEVPVSVKGENKKKKQEQKVASITAKKNATNKKPVAEKENKSSALNRNESGKNIGNNSVSKPKPVFNAVTADKSRPEASDGPTDGGGRSVGFKLQNYENRDQKPRRNFKDGGALNNAVNEYNNDQQRAPRQFRERENRGPPRNRNGDTGLRSGKREFDRQSGSDKTGVKAIDKRNGAGAHNWGSAKQDIDDLNKSNTDTDAILTDKEESGNDQSAEQVAAPEEDDETKELTLDEWKALHQTRNKPQFNIRKAGEGEDTSQWKKMIALNKKKDCDSEEELEYDPSMYPQRVGRLQRIVDIQFNFNDGRRIGFGGFGRGRGRGGMRSGGDRSRFEGGRGNGFHGDAVDRQNLGRTRNYGEKASRGEPITFKVDDERQFPTLS